MTQNQKLQQAAEGGTTWLAPVQLVRKGFFDGRKQDMPNIQYILSRLMKKARGNALRDSHIDRNSKVESGSTLVRTTFARHSYSGYDCTFVDCEIGAFCSIASKVTMGGSRHPIEYVSTSPAFLDQRNSIKTKYALHRYERRFKTTVGNDVWIGESVLVKGGVTIGHGAIIGMGSVVTKDVAPYTIVAGNPAKLIRVRFAPDIVQGLLKLQWWDLPDDELRRLGPLFNDPERLLREKGLF
jgi:acetyltransferase-like isoleucine patch superfamily enzyme